MKNWAELSLYLAEQTGMTSEEINILAHQDNSHHYEIYTIKPEGKKARQIEEPMWPLLEIQRALNFILEEYKLSDSCISIKGKSIVDNGIAHKDAKHLLKVDISKCYQSISYWHLPKEYQNIIELCMLPDHNVDWYLPTGAPTSPKLCNIALSPIDTEIEKIFRDGIFADRGYRYTRYLDDLIISTTLDKRDWELLDVIEGIVNKHGLDINKKKSRWFTLGNDPMIVTGVNIGHQVGAPREIKRKMRVTLYQLASNNEEIDEVTRGTLAYIKSIDANGYDKLISYYNGCKNK